jgi:hypothetical protein
MELLRDPKVEQQFQKLVTKFLAKNEKYDMNTFIGGLPVTLERSDMSNLMSKNQQDQSRYTVTQKVDGARVLMYIGPDTGISQVKQRTVCFIDRNMKIYTVRNETRDILPYVNTREMLLDGEIVFFDKDGTAHKELESRYVKGVSFMAFDILFGPENIDITPEDTKVIGQEFSFIVPEDGKLKTFPWKYLNRYDILHKLIIPSRFNKSEPILVEAFKRVNWFNVELKPIYFLNTLAKHRVLYNDSKTGYLQTLLSGERKNFYDFLMKKYNKQVNTFIKKTLKLDGLIFTASDTLYTIGSWDKLLTTQYKWKPSSEQTVDLLVKKINPNVASLFVSKRGNIEPYQVNYRQVNVEVPQYVKDDDVAEFSLDENGKFVFKELRKDKKTPNALRTVINVVNSFKNPVNINDLYYFLNFSEKSTKSEIKKILEYSTKTKLLQCVANHKSINLLESNDLKKLNDMIKNVNINKEIEVELRFGLLKQRFNPVIVKPNFLNILKKVESLNFKKEIDDFIDIYSDKVRTRYKFSEDYGVYIFNDSIIKNRISNIDITMNHILSYDVRFAMSSEVKVKQYNDDGECFRKYRTSFVEPNGLFRIDFTAITEGVYINRNFVLKQDSSEIFQIEIEFLKSDININNLFKFITHILGN